ncbi:MAG: ribulose-phosphate 3-epimerase [Acidimicrobiales bacterium]|nr:ribulose-phosphate 3-epimerase [Acidimicrobiales bacterium]
MKPAAIPESPGTDRQFEIVPSVLPADFAHFGDACIALEKAGVDRIQFDIMDGRFVPNLTFGPDLVAAVRPLVSVPFEAHLMVHEPDWLFERFIEAGCELLIVHAEAVTHLHRALVAIRDAGARAAVALNPATPVDAVQHVLDLVDMVLVMTVNPGFGGQSYLASMEAKITQLRSLVLERGLDLDIEVDGGIGPSTVAGAAAAGANVLVAGSSLFRDEHGLDHAVRDLRERAEATRATQPARADG